MRELSPTKTPLLIIDDSTLSHQMTTFWLRDLSLQLWHAADADTGYRMAREHHPELILLDVRLPESDGFEVCRQLKADPATAEIPVIFLTARDEIDDKLLGFELGAVDYITKPFDGRELRVRVQAALRAKTTRDRLRAEAMIDDLTGLRNRRHFERALADALSRPVDASGTEATDHPLAYVGLILVDLDWFKQVNDRLGHVVGDRVLKRVGQLLREACPPDETPCRLGGDEFVVLLRAAPDTLIRDRARQILWRVRRDEILNSLVPEELAVRSSVGVAWSPLGATCSPEQLLVKADRALYEAKNDGRDRLAMMHQPQPEPDADTA